VVGKFVHPRVHDGEVSELQDVATPRQPWGMTCSAAASSIELFIRWLVVTQDVFTNDAFQSVCGLGHDVLQRDMPCIA
jgi:hypothetical protein